MSATCNAARRREKHRGKSVAQRHFGDVREQPEGAERDDCYVKRRRRQTIEALGDGGRFNLRIGVRRVSRQTIASRPALMRSVDRLRDASRLGAHAC